MSEKQKKDTCTICIDEITPKKEAKIDSCSHKFCFECIQSWALKSENSCPNCKKKFHKIIYKNDNYDETILNINNKSNDEDDEEDEVICFIC